MAVKLNALLIDPSAPQRSRLKSAMRIVPLFQDVIPTGSLEEAVSIIEEHDCIDVIFQSYRLGGDNLSVFVKNSREKRSSRDAAFILTLDGGANASNCVADLMKGADGFLVEPYSVDSLVEITHIAEKVRSDRRKLRFDSAMRILVHELVSQVGQLAFLEGRGYPGRISWKVFEEMCSVLRDLDPPLREHYYQVAIELFSMVPPPSERKVDSGAYVGVSQRIRKKASTKALQRFKEALVA
jgi:CheY-like chemotaxis protein